MVLNFLRGGAAINVLARQAGARVVVADVGVAADLPEHEHLRALKIARGTQNFARGPAMSRVQAARAVEIGIELAAGEAARGLDLVALDGIREAMARGLLDAVDLRRLIQVAPEGTELAMT